MATISFTTAFDLTLGPKQFTFTDTSDYLGQGIAVVNVNGSFKITSPSGVVIYNNTDYSDANCDIPLWTQLVNQTTIQLPLGVDLFSEAGVYTIVYTVYDDNLLTYSTVTNSYTYGYTQPTVTITQTTDCISPLFISVDTTNYVVSGITPTIDRVHTIDYPYGSAGEGNPTIGIAATISTSTFYNGTQTTEIESDLTYTFQDGLIVIDFVSGVQEAIVDCSDICGIYCCIRSIEQQWLSAPNPSPSRNTLESLFTQVMGLIGMVQFARTCNKSADISGYLTAIKNLAHCTDDCDCSGDQPTQVMGLAGLVNNVIVASSGAPLVVTPVTVGNTTTYTITFDATLLTKLNTLYNTVVAAGSGVTVTPATVGYTTTYTVAASLISDYDTSTASLAIPSGDVFDTVVSVAPSNGTYIAIFNGSYDYSTVDAVLATACLFGLSVNGAAVPAVNRRLISTFQMEAGIISLTNVFTLSATDEVGLWGNQTSAVIQTVNVSNRSITLIRIA